MTEVPRVLITRSGPMPNSSARVDHPVRPDAEQLRASAAAIEPVKLAGCVAVVVDRENAADLDGQPQQIIGRVLALGPAIDLHGDAAVAAGAEHRLGAPAGRGAGLLTAPWPR
jgi:hypothetical protein